MTVLTASKLAGRHTYLSTNRPDWRRSMESIKEQGGPWACGSCDAPSYLAYRCSMCGRDLAKSDTSTAGRAGR